MSIASEITRLQNAKGAIKTAIEDKGVTVGDKLLDKYASLIDSIETGDELPAGVSGLAYGTFTPGSDLTSKTVTHDLGDTIKGVIAWCDATSSDVEYKIIFTMLLNVTYSGTGSTFAAVGTCCFLNSAGTSKSYMPVQYSTAQGSSTTVNISNNDGDGKFKSGSVYRWIAWC